MTAAGGTMTRIGERERELSLDVLRGIAILFILLMNIPYTAEFTTPDLPRPDRLSWTGIDQVAWWTQKLLDGTQRGLLELLFGAGIVIMSRAGEPVTPPGALRLHIRRNLLLMAFGVAHGLLLLWPGDILLAYGAAALLAWPFRVLSPRWLAAIALALVLLSQAGQSEEWFEDRALATAAARGDPAATATLDRQLAEQYPTPAQMAEETAARTGSFAAFARYAQQSWIDVQFEVVGLFYLVAWEAVSIMLLGMALFKTGVLQGRHSARFYAALLAAGYGLGGLLRVPAILDTLRFDAGPHFGDATGEIARLLLVLGHVAAVNLTLKAATGRALLRPFVATGRMPLTTYMGASVLTFILFWGFGLWGTMGYGGFEGIALLIILAQLTAANFWLRAFSTGPIDCLWKSLVYGRAQPWRRPGPNVGAEVTA